MAKSLTPFQAISIAIGGTVGVSNMSGVATAIATGGPGALVLAVGSCITCHGHKMTEVTLAVYYREKQAKRGIPRRTDLLYAERSGKQKETSVLENFCRVIRRMYFYDMVHHTSELYSI